MAKFSNKKNRIRSNPKDLIRYHLQKRRTNKTHLYFLMIVTVFAFGVLNLIMHTESKTQAEVLTMQDHLETAYNENVQETVPAVHGVFPATKQEVLLQKMMEKEGYVMTEQERLYFEN